MRVSDNSTFIEGCTALAKVALFCPYSSSLQGSRRGRQLKPRNSFVIDELLLKRILEISCLSSLGKTHFYLICCPQKTGKLHGWTFQHATRHVMRSALAEVIANDHFGQANETTALCYPVKSHFWIVCSGIVPMIQFTFTKKALANARGSTFIK